MDILFSGIQMNGNILKQHEKHSEKLVGTQT